MYSARKTRKQLRFKKNGFDRGYKIEKIIGVKPQCKNGKPMFVIKWENIDTFEEVESKVMNKKVPQMVIAYYQKHIIFSGKFVLYIKKELKLNVYKLYVVDN